MNTLLRLIYPMEIEEALIGLALAMAATVPLMGQLMASPLSYDQQMLYLPMLSSCLFFLWYEKYRSARYASSLKKYVWTMFFTTAVWYGCQAAHPEYQSMPRGIYFVIGWVAGMWALVSVLYHFFFDPGEQRIQDRITPCLDHRPKRKGRNKKLDIEKFQQKQEEDEFAETYKKLNKKIAELEEKLKEHEDKRKRHSKEELKKMRAARSRKAQKAIASMDKAYYKRKKEYLKNVEEEMQYFKEGIEEGLYTEDEVKRIMEAFRDLCPNFRGF